MTESKPMLAVVGCGAWGKNLVRNFHELGALSCINDQDSSVARIIAAKYEVESCTLEEILVNPTILGIVISTPAEKHAALTRRALSAGKHVFVEKPLALDIDDAEALCELADKEARILMVGHLLQYHPAFLKLRKICEEGDIGNIRYIYSNRLNLGKFRTEENILWSFAPHDISMILTLFGVEPETVFAVGHAYLDENIPDVTTTHIKFSGGQAAHIHVSWLHPFKEQRLVVIGEEGMVVFDDGRDWAEKVIIYPHRVDWQNGIPMADKADAEPVLVDSAEPLRLECQHFLDCIKKGSQPITDAREGLRVLRVLDAAQRSMETGKTIAFTAQGQA